jgi:hypothetical protein
VTWTKLSDDFADDCDQLSSDAFRLHVEGLIRSNRKLLDLHLDKTQMPRWVWNVGLAEIAVKELLASGWWSDEGDHYLIRHHACYQRTREQVLRQQEVNRANRAKGKARPVREQATEIRPEDEPSDDSSDERDWFRTGLDRQPKEPVDFSENGNGSGPALCRYCDNELRPSMRSQHLRGYCNLPACIATAQRELAG